MKKLIFTIGALVLANAAFSQTCSPSDSTIMGSGATNDVYFSMKKSATTGNGTVKSVSNTNWHLAFSVQASRFPYNPANGVAIRVNSPLGENPQTGATGCKLVKIPAANWSNWHNLDTTGMSALPELIDSDSTWDLSAFTSGYSTKTMQELFDFKWGAYNQTTHNVTGTSVFVLYNKTQGWYKKIFINQVTVDTMWDFTIANIDNTDSNFVQIRKKAYPNRNFVYYNVLTNTVSDREPDNRTWDLLWTKYKGQVQLGPNIVPYTVTGVLHNNGVKVAQNMGKKCPDVWLSNKTAKSEPSISTIGYDWKTFTGTAYSVPDTIVYFVDAKDTNTYKMTLLSFTGGSQGKTVLATYKATVGIEDNEIMGSLDVYPNPANSTITVKTDDVVETVKVYDVFGKNVANTNNATVNISDLNSGVYMVVIKTDKGLFQQRFIKQ